MAQTGSLMLSVASASGFLRFGHTWGQSKFLVMPLRIISAPSYPKHLACTAHLMERPSTFTNLNSEGVAVCHPRNWSLLLTRNRKAGMVDGSAFSICVFPNFESALGSYRGRNFCIFSPNRVIVPIRYYVFPLPVYLTTSCSRLTLDWPPTWLLIFLSPTRNSRLYTPFSSVP